MFPLPWDGFVVGLCLEDCRLLWQIGVSFLFSDNCPCVIVFFEIKSCVFISKNKIPLFVGAPWLLDILGAWMSGVMKFIYSYMCVLVILCFNLQFGNPTLWVDTLWLKVGMRNTLA